MPETGIKLIPRDEILTFEEICEFTQFAVNLGIRKVRLTGGEPLVREGIVELVRMLTRIEGITDFSMTTNGTLLARYAHSLADAGLHRVNISLDTMRPDRYTQITRGGNIHDVLAGIESARDAGLHPIKINCVVEKSSDEPDAKAVRNFAVKNGYPVRFIRKMSISEGVFYPVEGGTGGDCKICNRIRLTSDGYIKPCLMNDIKFSIRELGYHRAIQLALDNKPKSGTSSRINKFHSIGG